MKSYDYNINFWKPYIKRQFIGQVELLYKTVEQRFIPTFNSAEKEAEEITDKKWEELSTSPCSPDTDPADLAEAAQEEGIDYFLMLLGFKQTFLNTIAIGLYHLFEQQVIFLLRREIVHPSEEFYVKLMKINEFRKRLLSSGIDITKYKSWNIISELKHLANATKHGEGSSAEKLRNLRPDLFFHPISIERELGSIHKSPSKRLYSPLSGEDIYVSETDLMKYKDAIVNFGQIISKAVTGE
ncbi:MAG: hypothetical protein PF503_19175 [Desulfobacula sp.]|jgi:hypothetical protein|nr:hypothetical protein [Desulfobacula sp.]